jgi:hypothetical protein
VIDREELRARLFLRALLPLLETVVERSSDHQSSLADVRARARLRVTETSHVALLTVAAGKLTVSREPCEKPQIDVSFRGVRELNAFFAGGFALPRVSGLGHPVLLAKLARLLLSLRVLEPGPPPREPAERALRVRLVLELVTRALTELHFGGFPPMTELVSDSPERVYQWTVGGSDIAFWLRMLRGKLKRGSGVYAKRAPFVHFAFRDVDAALGVFGSDEHMSGVRDGAVQTFGSPEYTRKIAHLMQCVDQLMLEG